MEKPDEAAEQLFEGALELSPHEHQVFLDRARSGQPGLAQHKHQRFFFSDLADLMT
jgi:hypothetical protein